jgi:hypothetical protein
MAVGQSRCCLFTPFLPMTDHFDNGTSNALPPAQMSTISLPTLAYQSGVDRYNGPRKRWLGLTSLVCWIVTLLFSGVCLFVAFNIAKGWDGLGWLLVAFLGSWIGCGIGAIFGACGAFPRRKRHRFALPAFILNLVTGLGPITVVWIVSLVD